MTDWLKRPKRQRQTVKVRDIVKAKGGRMRHITACAAGSFDSEHDSPHKEVALTALQILEHPKLPRTVLKAYLYGLAHYQVPAEELDLAEILGAANLQPLK